MAEKYKTESRDRGVNDSSTGLEPIQLSGKHYEKKIKPLCLYLPNPLHRQDMTQGHF